MWLIRDLKKRRNKAGERQRAENRSKRNQEGSMEAPRKRKELINHYTCVHLNVTCIHSATSFLKEPLAHERGGSGNKANYIS